jgi:integrase
VDWRPTARCPLGTVRIPGTKTKRSERRVPLLPLARRHLEAHWKMLGKPASGPVFTWRGKRFAAGGTTFRTALASAVVRAGLEDRRVFPYLARHTAVTRARRRGVSREQVAAVMGHTNPRMIDETYDHTEVAERVDASWFKGVIGEG